MKRRADGRYQKRLSVKLPNGEKKNIFIYGKTKAEIDRKILNLKDQYDKGRKFKDVADEWWEVHSALISPSSYSGYLSGLHRALDAFSELRMTELTPTKISAYVNRLSAKYAYKTVKNHLMVINLICIHAINEGDIIYNPAFSVKVPRGLSQTKIHSPSKDDIEKIVASVNEPFGLFMFLALYTGMRRGELLSLEWSDFKDQHIEVNKSLYWDNGNPRIKKPKTESGIRTVPIINAIKPYLKKSGLVFPDDNGNYLTKSAYTYRLNQYKKRTGVKCNPHQLRHNYASMLYDQGIDANLAKDALGHSKISTTIDIYTDISKSKRDKLYEKIKDVVF